MSTFDLSDISWVRLSFVDVFGTAHSMQIPASRLAEAAETGLPFDGSSLEGRARVMETDMRLLPDTASLVRTDEGIARAVCVVLHDDGTPWLGDPRTALAMVLDQTGDLGAQYTLSAELEFYLLDEDDDPIDAAGYFIESEGLGMSVVREAAEKLEGWGIRVDSIHHEAGPGQYEIDLAALPAIELADALVLAKQTIRETAADEGLTATFMARPLSGQPGSGLHLHQRVGGRLVDDEGQLTDEGRGFVAGQLEHARGLSALASPTVNSYKRLHSGPEAPSTAVWAHANRGALIRLSPTGADGATIEYRSADPSANPYLLFAGLIISAAHGLGAQFDLPPAVEEESDGFDPAATDSSRADTLPRDLEEALSALQIDDVLVDAFDAQLLSRLLDGRRAEAAEYRSQVTPWEIELYLEDA
ncbi:MAG TPA: glutamine synthetase family protein [Coriobacteriia bacterium]